MIMFFICRDQILVNAIKKRTDDETGELMRQLLYLMYLRTASWADTSIPISVVEMKDAMKKNFPAMIQHLDQYLMIIGTISLYVYLYYATELYLISFC